MSNDAPKITKMVGSKGHSHEIIEVPNQLAQKVGGYHIDPASVARVQARLDALAEGYPDVAQPEWEALAALWPRLRAGKASASEDERLRRIVHDFKGQGGSVGYPLITEIADSLGELLRKADLKAETTRQSIDQHVAALGKILHDRIKGDGGPIGKALTAGLHALVAKCLGG